MKWIEGDNRFIPCLKITNPCPDVYMYSLFEIPNMLHLPHPIKYPSKRALSFSIMRCKIPSLFLSLATVRCQTDKHKLMWRLVPCPSHWNPIPKLGAQKSAPLSFPTCNVKDTGTRHSPLLLRSLGSSSSSSPSPPPPSSCWYEWYAITCERKTIICNQS